MRGKQGPTRAFVCPDSMMLSCLYIKRRRDLTDQLSITPAYLRNDYSSSGLVTDYRDWQIPLGRRFRALKIWFVIRTYGASGMKAHIRNHIELGQLFSSLVLTRPDLFKILTPPAFAVTVFSAVLGSSDTHSSSSQHETNARTKEIYERVNRKGDIFLTSSEVNGIYAIRVVSANPKAEERYIRRAFKILEDTAYELAGQIPDGGGLPPYAIPT